MKKFIEQKKTYIIEMTEKKSEFWIIHIDEVPSVPIKAIRATICSENKSRYRLKLLKKKKNIYLFLIHILDRNLIRLKHRLYNRVN